MTGNQIESRLTGALLLAVALSACAATGTGQPANVATTSTAEPARIITEEEQRNARDLGAFETEGAAIAAARAAGPAPSRLTLAELPERLIVIADDGRVIRALFTAPQAATGYMSSAPSRPPPPPK